MSHSRNIATYFLELSLPHDIFLHQAAVLNERGRTHRCAVDVHRMIATQPSGRQTPTDTSKQILSTRSSLYIVLMYALSTCEGCLWGPRIDRTSVHSPALSRHC
ncbi:unnamed protein product [Ectocarpus fasciculatus]